MARSHFFCALGAAVGGHPKVAVGGHRTCPVAPGPGGRICAGRRRVSQNADSGLTGLAASDILPGCIRHRRFGQDMYKNNI